MFEKAYSAHPCWCLQVSRLSLPPPPPPCCCCDATPLFTVSTTPADAILLAAEHAAVSPALLNYILCGVRGPLGACSTVHLHCCIAYNKVVCACSEPALHTLFILCVWLCCKFVCPRCPWRSILCILSLMKAPKRERGIRRRWRDGGGVKARVFSCGHFTITKLTRVRWAMARQQGDQSAATSIRTNCPDYTAAIS